MRRQVVGLLLAVACIAAPGVVSAQDAAALAEATVEDVVVTARRSGAPMWEVTRGDATVLLVGQIIGVPQATPWRPDALEAATLRSQRVLSGTGVRASLTDVFRVIWRARSLTRLPNETTSADYLSPEWEARLQAIGARSGEDYSRKSFLIASGDLLSDELGFDQATTDDAADVVRRAAREARIRVRSVDAARGDQVIENLLTAPPSDLVPCMQAAIVATEAGPDSLIARGRAWTQFRVAEVLASPLEIALGRCWPWGDPALGPQLKGAWLGAIETALGEPGVTMAVAPLTVLGEDGGVLDRLQAQGLEPIGPAWR